MRAGLGLVGLMVALTACVTGQDSAVSQTAVPIVLQPDSDHGSCSIGYRVNAGGADLRAGPSDDYPVVARLAAGHVVAGCAEQDGWSGVIGGTDETCSVGVILTKMRAYAGPCDSGWIDQGSITSIYG